MHPKKTKHASLFIFSLTSLLFSVPIWLFPVIPIFWAFVEALTYIWSSSTIVLFLMYPPPDLILFCVIGTSGLRRCCFTYLSCWYIICNVNIRSKILMLHFLSFQYIIVWVYFFLITFFCFSHVFYSFFKQEIYCCFESFSCIGIACDLLFTNFQFWWSPPLSDGAVCLLFIFSLCVACIFNVSFSSFDLWISALNLSSSLDPNIACLCCIFPLRSLY